MRCAVCVPSAARMVPGRETIATPQSSGTLGVLCASIAHESAVSTPSKSARGTHLRLPTSRTPHPRAPTHRAYGRLRLPQPSDRMHPSASYPLARDLLDGRRSRRCTAHRGILVPRVDQPVLAEGCGQGPTDDPPEMRADDVAISPGAASRTRVSTSSTGSIRCRCNGSANTSTIWSTSLSGAIRLLGMDSIHSIAPAAARSPADRYAIGSGFMTGSLVVPPRNGTSRGGEDRVSSCETSFDDRAEPAPICRGSVSDAGRSSA